MTPPTPAERCSCTHPAEDHTAVDAGCAWRMCLCEWFPADDIDLWVAEAKAARERRFARWRAQDAADRAAFGAARSAGLKARHNTKLRHTGAGEQKGASQ